MWQPTATLASLQLRAKTLQKIRQFFIAREILEVETPLLSQASVTDPHIASFSTEFCTPANNPQKTYYLQTSPEFAMKRLLAANSGAIFQIAKAFRNGEFGSKHNPEFTMLEWYRPDYDLQMLMDEVEDLLQNILACPRAERISYQQLFMQHCQLDPHQASTQQLKARAHQMLDLQLDSEEKNDWLNLLMSHIIEPHLGFEAPVFVYNFPQSQAALAQLRIVENQTVADRFEVYMRGTELANGFHELTDAHEQAKRFQQECALRKKFNLPEVPVDQNLLAALTHGLPACSGVALGIDRLIMLLANKKQISDVISFSFSNA